MRQYLRREGLVPSLLAFLLLAAACRPAPRQLRREAVAEGLLAPIGLALHSSGALFVAEAGTGQDDASGGVTLILPDGRSGRLVSGFPSTLDSGDLGGVNGVVLSADERTLYLAAFGQEALRTLELPERPELPDQPMGAEALGRTMTAKNRVALENPFDIAFDAQGRPVVSDAAENGLATVDEAARTVFFHRIPDLPGPPGAEGKTRDPVPTGILRQGEEYLVTLFGGCPYPDRGGRLIAAGTDRSQRTVVDGLDLPIDLARDRDGSLLIATFARSDQSSCFTGEEYLPETGAILRWHDGVLTTVVDGLSHVGGLAVAPDGSHYVTDVFAGRVIRLWWE